MNTAEPHSQRTSALLAGAIIVAALVLAYHRSFSGAFVFDDIPSIPQNPSIRSLRTAFSPPSGGLTVSGRPVLNLSLAASYALSGTSVWGYHLFNLTVHAAAALVLFGCVRRTLALWRSESESYWIGTAAALVWALHPLQTESVTYLVQRAESLMGLFYLLTLYCFIRGAAGPGLISSRVWYSGSVVACLLGAGTKEVIVSAPVMVLLYDRVFVAGCFRAAWRRRWAVYCALGASWFALAVLVYGNGSRGGTVQLNSKLQSDWIYWTTQGPAILRYLRLAIWPMGQAIDYGFETRWARYVGSAVPFNLAVAALLLWTIYLFGRRSRLAFLGLWFFAILAPTSIIPGLRQTVVEHRMYLALAPLCVLAALGLHRLWIGWRPAFATPTLAAIVGALGFITAERNGAYRNGLALWTDSVAHCPTSVSAHGNLANELRLAGRLPEAIEQCRAALKLEPSYVDAHINIGLCLEQLGRRADALKEYQIALRIRPNNADAHASIGVLLAQEGRNAPAAVELARAVALKPDEAKFHSNFGAVLVSLNRLGAAESEFRKAIALRADYADAEYNLGSTLRREGRLGEAVAPLREALRIEPRHVAAHYHLAMALHALGRKTEALAEFEQAVQLAPGFAEGHNNLGSALAEAGRLPEAQAQFESAIRLSPRYAEAHHNLGSVLRDEGHVPQAVQELTIAARLSPRDPAIRKDLDEALGYFTSHQIVK